jgi:hypothetical protein
MRSNRAHVVLLAAISSGPGWHVFAPIPREKRVVREINPREPMIWDLEITHEIRDCRSIAALVELTASKADER